MARALAETLKLERDRVLLVQVTYDPSKVSYRGLLDAFMDGHNPTQVNGQGHDTGSQYRGGIYTHTSEQRKEAEEYLKEAQSNYKVNCPCQRTSCPMKLV